VLRRVISKLFIKLKLSYANNRSHCPWVNNCVANNNHRHFVLYIVCLELGILVWVRLALACKSFVPINMS
jgi:hypothetical protein